MPEIEADIEEDVDADKPAGQQARKRMERDDREHRDARGVDVRAMQSAASAAACQDLDTRGPDVAQPGNTRTR
jgi:hypothetical protein